MKKVTFVTACVVLVAAPFVFAGVYVVGGAGGTGNTIPWWGNNSSYPEMRFQTIWFQSQIGEAGAITLVEHQDWSASSTGGTFTGCKILLCHTTLSAITNTFANNYGGFTPVTIKDGTQVIPDVTSGTWFELVSGASLFNYNNTNNLLFEVSWTGRSGGPNYINHTSSGQSGRVYANSATATTGTVTSGYGTVSRLTVTPTGVGPTSLGRVKSLYH